MAGKSEGLSLEDVGLIIHLRGSWDGKKLLSKKTNKTSNFFFSFSFS